MLAGPALAAAKAQGFDVPLRGTFLSFEEVAGGAGSENAYRFMGLYFSGASVQQRANRGGGWLEANGAVLEVALKNASGNEVRTMDAMSFSLESAVPRRFVIRSYDAAGRVVDTRRENVSTASRIQLAGRGIAKVTIESQSGTERDSGWGIDSLVLGDGPVPEAETGTPIKACATSSANGSMVYDIGMGVVSEDGKRTIKRGTDGCVTVNVPGTGSAAAQVIGDAAGIINVCFTYNSVPVPGYPVIYSVFVDSRPRVEQYSMTTARNGCVVSPVEHTGYFGVTLAIP